MIHVYLFIGAKIGLGSQEIKEKELMYFHIRHTNLNSPKNANRLHGMIHKGIQNRFNKKEEKNPDIDPEKQKFIENLQKQEFDFLSKGLNQT